MWYQTGAEVKEGGARRLAPILSRNNRYAEATKKKTRFGGGNVGASEGAETRSYNMSPCKILVRIY